MFKSKRPEILFGPFWTLPGAAADPALASRRQTGSGFSFGTYVLFRTYGVTFGRVTASWAA
jgi:hypothetical protein